MLSFATSTVCLLCRGVGKWSLSEVVIKRIKVFLLGWLNFEEQGSWLWDRAIIKPISPVFSPLALLLDTRSRGAQGSWWYHTLFQPLKSSTSFLYKWPNLSYSVTAAESRLRCGKVVTSAETSSAPARTGDLSVWCLGVGETLQFLPRLLLTFYNFDILKGCLPRQHVLEKWLVRSSVLLEGRRSDIVRRGYLRGTSESLELARPCWQLLKHLTQGLLFSHFLSFCLQTWIKVDLWFPHTSEYSFLIKVPPS